MCATDHPIMMGFEPLVNQRLLPPTFPRYAKIIKREDMVAYFRKLIERIKAVCEVISITNLHGILVNTPFHISEPVNIESDNSLFGTESKAFKNEYCVFRTSSVSSVNSLPACSPDLFFK